MVQPLEEFLRWGDTKGFDVREHNIRVGKIAYNFAKALNYNEGECDKLRTAGYLHDIGKLLVPISILNKKGMLNNNEFEIIKKHSLYSYLILRKYEVIEDICDIVKYHHENFDGSGYPFGIAGENIPMGARIIKICDVYDALTSNRVYRNKLNKKDALNIMDEEYSKYDPILLKLFKGMIINSLN